MSAAREKFSSQAEADTLQAMRELAKKEGRQFQSIVDEAFRDVVEKHRNGQPQPNFMTGYLLSVEKYGPLYKKLAE